MDPRDLITKDTTVQSLRKGAITTLVDHSDTGARIGEKSGVVSTTPMERRKRKRFVSNKPSNVKGRPVRGALKHMQYNDIMVEGYPDYSYNKDFT